MREGSLHTVYVEVNSGKRQRFGQQLVSNRMGYILASLAVTMLLAVALSGSDEGSGLAVKSAKFTKAKAQTQSLQHMTKVYARREEIKTVIAAATAGLPAGAKKLLKHIEAKARALPSLAAMKTTKLQDADCANKDVYEMILGKFTGLAANLTRDKDARFAENVTLYTEKAAAYTAWMDSESAYREAEARMTTAKSAVEYAQGEFDKYRTAVEAGEASYASTIAPMATEKADLEMQQDMIAEIVKLITGMAQPSATKATRAANLAQIEAKVSELSADKKMPKAMQQQALKIKKMTTALEEVSAATIANAMEILNEMADEITARVTAIDAATAEADKNLADDKAKKLKWQEDVVNLSNTADEEEAAANTADLARQQLSGVNKVKESAYVDQADSYDSDIAQYTEEITGVNQIVSVIQTLVDSC
jgi:uncharacterized protein (UPF0147 family)